MLFLRKSFLIFAILLTVVGGAAKTALARPVTYAGGWMLMQMNDPFMNSAMAIYSPTARLGVGPVFEHWRDLDANFAGVQVNALLRRWNGPDYQGNFYLLSSFGRASGNGNAGAAANVGIEADWENRRWFTSFENRVTMAEDITREYTQKGRIGVAPYIAEYGSLHTWLMLQVDHRPEDRDEVTVTPLVRVFKGAWLGEAGINNKGGVMFNTTFTF